MNIVIMIPTKDFDDNATKHENCVGCVHHEKTTNEHPCVECCNCYDNMYEEKKTTQTSVKRYTFYNGDFKKARKDFEEFCYPRSCLTCTLCDYRQDDCYSIWLMQEIEV